MVTTRVSESMIRTADLESMSVIWHVCTCGFAGMAWLHPQTGSITTSINIRRRLPPLERDHFMAATGLVGGWVMATWAGGGMSITQHMRST